MAIKAIAGAHLTATNRRHISAILANGWLQGESARLSYKLVPIEGAAGQYEFTIGQMETDMWGRPQYRLARGTIQAL